MAAEANEIGELRVLITAQADKFNSEITKVKNTLSSMSKATSNVTAKTVALGNILADAAKKSFGALVNVVKESKTVYNETAASMTKLATVMQQRGATQAQYDAVIKTTEAEERLGVVSASVQQNGLQELATYVGKAESLQKLTNVMNNLIVQQHGYNATADHALQTATMMGKVLQGQTGGLERIGYHLGEDEKAVFTFGNEEERVAALTAIVNDNLGDMNRRLGETNVGKQVQLANTWAQLKAQVGELATAIGNVLIPVFSAVANVAGRAIAYVRAFFKLFGVETGNVASTTASSVSDASDAVSSYGDAASNAAKKVKKSLAAFDEMNTVTEQSDSGSSGGGGVDILGDLEASIGQIDWGSLIPDVKLPKWFGDIKEMFSGIDFSKLQKSADKFWGSLKTSIEKVSGVGKKFVEEVIYPLAQFAAEDTLPRVFDALSGMLDSINFEGIGDAAGHLFGALERAGKYAQDVLADLVEAAAPLVSWMANFLVPPALEGMAFLLNAISSVLKGIWDGIMGMYHNAVEPLINAVTGAFEPILNFLNDMLGGVNSNNTVWETLTNIISGVVTVITGPLQIAFNVIATVIDTVVRPVIEVIVGVFEFFGEVLGINTGKLDDNTEAAERNRIELNESAKQYDKNKDSVLDLSETLNYLHDVMYKANKAEQDLIQAQKSQFTATEKLNEYCQKYNRTAEQLIEMHRKGELQSLDSGDALTGLTSAVLDLELANFKVETATQKYVEEQGELQSSANQTKEHLDAVGEELVQLAEDGGQFSEKWYELKEKIGQYGEAIKQTGKNVGEITNWEQKAEEAAENVVRGAVRGVVEYTPLYEQSLTEMARRGNQAFNAANEVHSPSRLFRKSAGFNALGAIKGIKEKYGDYAKALEGLAHVGADAFNGELSSANLKMTAGASVKALLELDSLGETIAKRIVVDNTVNIGSETFYNDIIDNINSQSALYGRNVINI